LPGFQEKTVGLWRRLAESHEKNRQFERARVIWKALLDRSLGDAVLQDRYAQTFTYGEDYADAVSGWMEMINQHPDIPELQIHLEHACDRQGQKEKRNTKIEEYRKDIKYWENLHSKDPFQSCSCKIVEGSTERTCTFRLSIGPGDRHI